MSNNEFLENSVKLHQLIEETNITRVSYMQFLEAFSRAIETLRINSNNFVSKIY